MVDPYMPYPTINNTQERGNRSIVEDSMDAEESTGAEITESENPHQNVELRRGTRIRRVPSRLQL